ncbi:MAG: DUF2293 domain-containing protein [Pirellulaceae bacterium]|nr:DUF2293 domain-containing protein [Pirellulaceae bacterium]
METTRVVQPGPSERSVKTSDGVVLEVPAGWELLPPGDAGLTRRVKAAGASWTVQEKKGRKTFSRGVWAPASHIRSAKAELEIERGTEAYAKKRQAAAVRREREQVAYVDEFSTAVYNFLRFDSRHETLARQMAQAIADHATPIGSGTVARTERIPVEQRAEAAVIAWMRHQTTGYDDMHIPRVKGQRREVRRMLAERSRHLLEKYRSGKQPENCPLARALELTLPSGPSGGSKKTGA